MLTPIVINDAGFANKAKVILSPNFDSRPSKSNVNLIVIHNISLPPRIYEGNNIIDLFTNKLNPDDHEYFKSISNLKVSS
ncbi:MAG: 1,6-anhydro-N-acetylmuramyl-L-alanine amidase AmpD, partial [Candidatus Methylopumilus sp.]